MMNDPRGIYKVNPNCIELGEEVLFISNKEPVKLMNFTTDNESIANYVNSGTERSRRQTGGTACQSPLVASISL